MDSAVYVVAEHHGKSRPKQTKCSINRDPHIDEPSFHHGAPNLPLPIRSKWGGTSTSPR